ncbi:ATP-binding protein [Sporomusa aerivorans]|uniref:ATP-binding protein n=1 Tax=Sporomusa aerivorans TaxID=204936 RepID=UPI003529EE9A
MTLSNLTTRLNVKAICIISVFMLFFTIYNQWTTYRDRSAMHAQNMEALTAYLAGAVPADMLLEIRLRKNGEEKSPAERFLAVHNKIQPIMENIFVSSPTTMKFGVYSRELRQIVALGPEVDKSLLWNIPPAFFDDMFETDTAKMGEQQHSVLWYGSHITYYVRPIKHDNEIIGYFFACTNLDKVKDDVFLALQKNAFGNVAALLITIMLFQDIFIRLKKELTLFAEATVEGRGRDFESKIPELNPILQYLSQQTEQMARLDRLNIIGEMAASIGHEVRNPMTTVRGFLQYLGKKPAFDDYKSQFELMIDELDRANSIITDFLSLAKNKTMNFKDSDLNTIIRDVIPMLEADALRFKCEIKLALGKIPLLSLDINSLRQLILNIVRNGIEAMPEGGKVEISTYSRGSQVVLSFADEGSGISNELLDRLGTPFFTTKENGVGLGLAVCYRIVQRHGATIAVESQPGQGTRFTITFSRETEEQ